MPSSSWPTPCCALRHRWPRCPPSASNRCSAALTAVSIKRSSVAASMKIDSASCSSSTDRQGWPLVFAVDASTWDRCDAECSPERGFYYSASKHSAGQPIVAGWNYQWICQLDWAYDSWTAPLDVARIPPRQDATAATAEQIRRLVGLLPGDGPVPLFVFDAGYNPTAIGHDLAEERCECLTRIRDDRVFYADPPPRPNRPARSGGRPPRHGRRFKCSDRRTQNKPDECLDASDPRYGNVSVMAWHRMHPRVTGRGRWADYGGSAAHRARQRYPRRRRALAQGHLRDEEDVVALLVRAWRA